MRRLILPILLLFSVIYCAFAVQVESSGNKIIYLRHADKFINVDSSIGVVRRLIGNVWIDQGDITLKSNRAIQFMATNITEMTGEVRITQREFVLKSPFIIYHGNSRLADADLHVRIEDGNMTLDADKGKYSMNSQIADFYGNVVIDDDSVRITSDIINFERTTQISRAYGNVEVRGKFTNAVLFGDTVMNYPKRQYSIVIGRPLLYQIDTIKTNEEIIDSISNEQIFKFDTLSISSDTMESDRSMGEEIYLFTGNVELVKGNLKAVVHKCLYNKKTQKITLSGKPVVWFEKTQLHSDSLIVMNFPEDGDSYINSFGKSFASMYDDSTTAESAALKDRIQQLSGDEIRIMISNDSVRSIQSTGDAKSLYFMISDDGGEGVDRKGSDTIVIDFSEGAPENIFWYGGVEGEFIPEIMIYSDVKKWYLPDFKRSDKEPQRRSPANRKDAVLNSADIKD